MSEKRQHGARVREQWIELIASGEKSVSDAVFDSSDDRKHILNIPLLNILSAFEGWDKFSARNALLQKGFHNGAKLNFIAQRQQRIAEFQSLIDSSFHRWVPNVTFPEGYPFFGKFDAIMAQSDVSEYVPNSHDDPIENDDDVAIDIDSELDSLLGDL